LHQQRAQVRRLEQPRQSDVEQHDRRVRRRRRSAPAAQGADQGRHRDVRERHPRALVAREGSHRRASPHGPSDRGRPRPAPLRGHAHLPARSRRRRGVQDRRAQPHLRTRDAMRKLISFMVVTLDGYYEGPNAEFDWPNVDDEFNEFAISQLDDIDTLLFGRATYDGMASYWPTPAAIEDSPDVAGRMNSVD